MPERTVRISYKISKGIDRTKDPVRIFASKPEPDISIQGLIKGENVDIDSTGGLSRRGGSDKLFDLANSHSLEGWPDICLIVGSNSLRRVNDALSSTSVLKAGVYGERVSYCRILDDIYFSDGIIIGKIAAGTYADLPAVTVGFRKQAVIDHVALTQKPMPAGQLLEKYDNKLLSAVGNRIWKSAPLAFHRTSKRYGLFHWAEGNITLLKEVKDGVIVSDSHSIYFLRGPLSKGMEKTVLANYPAIIHAVEDIPQESMSLDIPPGKYFKFLTTRGICVAGDGGYFKNLTIDKYPEIAAKRGTALYREIIKTIFGQKRTIKQVVFTCEN